MDLSAPSGEIAALHPRRSQAWAEFSIASKIDALAFADEFNQTLNFLHFRGRTVKVPLVVAPLLGVFGVGDSVFKLVRRAGLGGHTEREARENLSEAGWS